MDFVDTSLLPPVEGECSLQVKKLWIFTLKRITETRYFSVFRKVVNISGKNIGLTEPNYFDLVCLIFHLFQTFEEALRSRICMASWCARILWGKKIIPI